MLKNNVKVILNFEYVLRYEAHTKAPNAGEALTPRAFNQSHDR